MNPVFAEAGAVALELVPIAVVLTARRDRGRSLGEIALEIPLAVAADLLGTLILASVLRLDWACFAARALWLAYAAQRLARREARLGWPTALTPRVSLVAAVAALFAIACSASLSRTYVIHDRTWHAPLVASLGGQRLPFLNVFEGADPLRYHAAGDVFAACFRAFSFHVLTAYRALAATHDLLFGLVAASATLVVLAADKTRLWPALLAGPALLLCGPVPLAGRTFATAAYAYYPFLSLSFRPHVPLSALWMVGFVGAIAARARSNEPTKRVEWLTLAATMTALGITDEASGALLGVGLFVAWLDRPKLLATRRAPGLAWLVLFASGAAVASAAFSGSLGATGPVRAIAWATNARVASVTGAPPALVASRAGALALLVDLAPFGAAVLALGLGGRKSPSLRAPFAFALAVLGLAALLGTHVDVNGSPSEAQRFFVAPFFAGPLLALASVRDLPRLSLARAGLLFGALVPPLISLHWLAKGAEPELGWASYTKLPWARKLLALDCREVTGARLGEPPRRVFVETAAFATYTSCRPTFVAGHGSGIWPLRVYPTEATRPQLSELDRVMVPRGQPFEAICSGPTDPVCEVALKVPARCDAEGADFHRCLMSIEDRARLASGRW